MASAVENMETSEESDKMTSAVDNMETSEESGVATLDKHGSPSPSRPSVSPTLPAEDAHGMSRSHSPEGDDEDCIEIVGAGITQEMLDEEKKLEQENDKEANRIRREMEERDKDMKKLKEKRYKRLMHLLTKSEFYAQFLLKQIETQDAENKQKMAKIKSVKTVVGSDKENSSSGANSSQESSGSEKKGSKRKKSPLQSNKRLRDDNYKIGDVIDSKTVKEIVAAEETEEVERVEQPRLFENGTMRPYQLDGLSWLTVLYENGVNGILGDEMGLGKTIQCIALICHLIDKGVQGPFLILGPLSTLPNWMSEFKRFSPKVPTVLYHGHYTQRKKQRKLISKLVKVPGAPSSVYPVVITTYQVAVTDARILNKFQWRYICVDEGHRLKNHQCSLAKNLNTYMSSNRLLLTGTPLQNSLAELWALLNFLMPDIFDSLDVFEQWFNVTEMMEEGGDERIVEQEKENQVIQTLMKILSPFFLRRIKKEVNLDLPPKRELLVYTPMTEIQIKMYEATLAMNMDFFNELKQKSTKVEPVQLDERGRPMRQSKKPIDYTNAFTGTLETYLKSLPEEVDEVVEVKKERTSVLNVKLQSRFMQCRRIVNHPYLVNYPLNKDGSYKMDEGLVKACGKLQVLDQLLAELHKTSHRILLFSQSTMLLNVLEDYLTLRPHYKYKRLDGSCALEDRQESIDQYNEDSSIFLFLISTRAGGLGINLASADTVIIYDSDWNPQCDLQAQDRCHRIGQTRPVLILRLITSSTIDERMVDRATTKRKLEKLIIQSGKFTKARQVERAFEKFDADELFELLRKRDFDRVHRTKTGNVFSQEELDQLLDRSDLINHTDGSVSPSKHKLKGVFKCLDTE